MNAFKTILYSMIGALLALAIHDSSLRKESAKTQATIQTIQAAPVVTTPIQAVKTNTSVKSELSPAMAELTIVNGSHNQVQCMNASFQVFLTLNPNEKRSYGDIQEGKRIGCSALGDGDAKRTWFYATNGVYTVLAERDKTVIMTDKGEVIR